MKKVVIFLVLVLASFLGETAQAQLFLEEGKVVLSVSPGERVNKSITVANTSNEAMNVRAYWQDFEYKPPYEGPKDFKAEGSSRYTLQNKISFSPATFNIPAFGKQKIDYTIDVPQDAKGGYYGVLFFEKAPDLMDAKVGLSIVTRVGTLFFVETNTKSKQSKISDISAKKDKITGNFVNQGDVILIPRMTYNILDKEGLVADRGELKKLYVPPGASAQWEIVLPKAMATGQYSLVLSTDLEEGDVLVTEITISIDDAGLLTIDNIQD